MHPYRRTFIGAVTGLAAASLLGAAPARAAVTPVGVTIPRTPPPRR